MAVCSHSFEEEKEKISRFKEDYFRNYYLNEPFELQIDIEKICRNIIVETRGTTVRIDHALKVIQAIFLNMKNRDRKRLIHDLFTNAFPEYEIEKNYNYDMDYLKREMEEIKRKEVEMKLKRLLDEKQNLINELNKDKDQFEYFKNHVNPILREVEELHKDFISKDEMEV